MRERRLARSLGEFSDTLVSDHDVEEFSAQLCQRFVEVMEVSAAGAMLTDRQGWLQVAAASTETVAALERLQVQRWQGPCAAACYGDEPPDSITAVAQIRNRPDRPPPQGIHSGFE